MSRHLCQNLDHGAHRISMSNQGCKMRVFKTVSNLLFLCQCISPNNPRSYLHSVNQDVFVPDNSLHKTMKPNMCKFLRHYLPLLYMNIYGINQSPILTQCLQIFESNRSLIQIWNNMTSQIIHFSISPIIKLTGWNSACISMF